MKYILGIRLYKKYVKFSGTEKVLVLVCIIYLTVYALNKLGAFWQPQLNCLMIYKCFLSVLWFQSLLLFTLYGDCKMILFEIRLLNLSFLIVWDKTKLRSKTNGNWNDNYFWNYLYYWINFMMMLKNLKMLEEDKNFIR